MQEMLPQQQRQGRMVRRLWFRTVAMNVAETTLNYKMMEKFKELAEEKSGGSVKLNLYANGQLGNDTEQMQDFARRHPIKRSIRRQIFLV